MGQYYMCVSHLEKICKRVNIYKNFILLIDSVDLGKLITIMFNVITILLYQMIDY